MVKGFPSVDEEKGVCVACLASKQHKESFDKGKDWRVKGVLEFDHNDYASL